MTNYVIIFIIGVIIGIVLMAIITAANNVQWGCRDDTKSEEQEIIDQLKAADCVKECVFEDELNEFVVSVNAIDHALTVTLPNEQIAWEQGYEAGLAQGHQDGVKEVLSGLHQGEWINHRNDYGHNIADCSLCGKTMQWHDEDEDGIPRYCWYCGAPMKGVKNGNNQKR